MPLTLASTSPSRLQLLRMAGIDPIVIAPEVDEEAVAEAAGELSPGDYVQLLATSKARAVAAKEGIGTTLVLGCDSAFEFDGDVYGKPGTPDVALERWLHMRGRAGVLHTGHCLIDPATGMQATRVVSTEVEFAEVTEAEVQWYVSTGEPLNVAGAFTLEGLAAPFITRVVGDPHAVVGLSLATLRELAIELGSRWSALIAK